MTIQDLRDRGLIVYECISGSKSYGLDVPGSDTDLKGVFILPEHEYFSIDYIPQVTSEKNDEVFYELRRFFELLLKNNPNIIEMLGTPEEFILQKHPLINAIYPDMFLSKLCRDTFANYAFSQIRKAVGLNKKMNKPMERERKDIMDFCHVIVGAGTIPVRTWLKSNGLTDRDCGLTAIDHMRDMYALFIDKTGAFQYRGIAANEDSNDVSVSSVPKGEVPAAYMHFNKDNYSTYCKEYKSYWEWVENRNQQRYQGNLTHGKSYDAKNMMHVFRLLDMALEIGQGKGVLTRRKNREWLLDVKSGKYEYEELLLMAEKKLEEINAAYSVSSLPEKPDEKAVNELLCRIRKEYYSRSSI